MAFNTTYNGGCPAPFYDASYFPQDGGYIEGRLCTTSDILPGQPTCCLPCPATQWTYSDNFNTYNTVAECLNVVGFGLLVFMLISYFFLPVQHTRSHYLSISLIVAIIFINLGFIVPLGAQPNQCYNEITPNDMYSSMTCAWSGAFIIAGGISGTAWIFVRALSMHLQICWDIVPGRKFFYLSQILGWGIPAAIFAATMTVTGVSFRFGNACHVNHHDSMQVFWGWLLATAAAAVIIQLSTFGYCAHVFITNLWSDERPPSTASGTSLPTYTTSIRTQTAKAIWRRLKTALLLQWRGLVIVTLTLIDVIFFAVVFVYLDDLESSLKHKLTTAKPWLLCLVLSGGDKNACLAQAQNWLVDESVVAAVLIMLSLIGFEVFCMLFRWSFITGWKEFFVQKFRSRKREFVSLDALSPSPMQYSSAAAPTRNKSVSGIAFEMQRPKEFAWDVETKTIAPVVRTVATPPDAGRKKSSMDRFPPSMKRPSSPVSPISNCPPRFGSPFSTPERRSDAYHNTRQRPDSAVLPSPRLSSESDTQMRPSYSSSRMLSHSTVQSMGWDPTSTYAPATVTRSPRPLASVAQVPRPAEQLRPDSRGFSPGQAL